MRVGDAVCGAAGILRRDLAAEWRLAAEPVALAETRLAPLLARAFETPVMAPLPAHPSVVRDVAMVVGREVRHERVLEVIRKVAPKVLTDVRLFDMYTDVKTVGMGRKSVAYSLTYRSPERTLTDEEVNTMHLEVVNALRNELQAEIREG
jgi:phenylalanyl-tRNA synthetase beta chain